MANNIDITLDKQILDAVTKGGTVTVTAPIKMKILSANGTNSTNGTEITPGGSYTAGGFAVNSNFGSATTVGGQGSVTNSTDISKANMPAATVTGAELWDSSATPKRVAQGPLAANKTVAAGDTLTVSAGSFTITLA